MSDMNDRERLEANGNAAICAALHTMVQDGFISEEKAQEFKHNYSVFSIRKGGIIAYLRKRFFKDDSEDYTAKYVCVKLPKYDENEN